MAIYSASQRTTVTAAAGASWEIRSASTNKPKIMEVGLSQNAATAGVYGLGRPAAIGTVPTNTVTFLGESDGGTGTPGDNEPTGLTVASPGTWTAAPTVPANFFRRISCPATIGAGVIWTFPRGLGIAQSNSVVIWIIATAPVCDVWAVCDE